MACEVHMEPPKARRTPHGKVPAVAKAKATRLARHTMGKRQRLAIHAPPLPTAPAAPSGGQ